MLTINQILKYKPAFILSVNYNCGSIGEMSGDESTNEYLAEMTIQYYSLVDDACLAFYVECLVSVTDNLVTIEEMNTSQDYQSVYANNISDLSSFNGNSVMIWSDDICDDMHKFLVDLIESQPIDDIPEHFIIESY